MGNTLTHPFLSLTYGPAQEPIPVVRHLFVL